MNTQLLILKIAELNESIDNDKKQIQEYFDELIKQCPHNEIKTKGYESRTFIDSPEMRICSICGLEEHGWMNHISSILKTSLNYSEITHIDFDELSSIRESLTRHIGEFIIRN